MAPPVAASFPVRHGVRGHDRVRHRGTPAAILRWAVRFRRSARRPARFPVRRDAVRRRSFPRRAVGPSWETPCPPALFARDLARLPAARSRPDARLSRHRRHPGRRRERHAGDSPSLHSRQHDEGRQGAGAGPDRGCLRARPHGRTCHRRPAQPPLIERPSPLRLSPGPHQLRLRLPDPTRIPCAPPAQEDPSLASRPHLTTGPHTRDETRSGLARCGAAAQPGPRRASEQLPALQPGQVRVGDDVECFLLRLSWDCAPS